MNKLFGQKKTAVILSLLGCMSMLFFLDSSAQCKSYNWKISQGIAEDHPAAARSKGRASRLQDRGRDPDAKGRAFLTGEARSAWRSSRSLSR